MGQFWWALKEKKERSKEKKKETPIHKGGAKNDTLVGRMPVCVWLHWQVWRPIVGIGKMTPEIILKGPLKSSYVPNIGILRFIRKKQEKIPAERRHKVFSSYSNLLDITFLIWQPIPSGPYSKLANNRYFLPSTRPKMSGFQKNVKYSDTIFGRIFMWKFNPFSG